MLLFDTGSDFVAPAGLTLPMQTKLTLNSHLSVCLYLLSAEIINMYHYTWQQVCVYSMCMFIIFYELNINYFSVAKKL